MKKSTKITASLLLVLTLMLCFASCAAKPAETVESLLAAGKYDEALQKAQESGDTAAELSVTIEKNTAEAANAVLSYIKAAAEVLDEDYVYTRLIRAGTTYGADVSSEYLWYMLELERDNGKKDLYFLSADNYKLLAAKIDGADTTATDYACTVLGVDDAPALGSLFNKMAKVFLYGDLDDNPDDKITVVSDEGISRLNGIVNF